MKITGVRSVTYTYQLDRAIGDVHLPEGTNVGSDIAVFVDTDDGVTGVAVGMGHGPDALQMFEDVLVGADPRSVKGLWERMAARVFKLGVAGAPKLAMASLDVALWDLRAKAAGVPLWKELGALEGRVPAYASGLDMPLSDSELAAYYARMAGFGIRAGKLKVGRDHESDLRRLGIMRDALVGSAKQPLLMVDANEYWSAKEAIRRVRSFEEAFSLTWVEEPAPRRDAVGLRKVSNSVIAAVATGENLDSASDFANLIRAEAIDVVQLSTAQGGITPALRIAELAYANDLPVTMNNCPGRHMAHVAAALPHHTMMEVLDCGRDKVFESDTSLSDGHVILGDGPGSGIRFVEDRLAEHATDAPSALSLAATYRKAVGAGVMA